MMSSRMPSPAALPLSNDPNLTAKELNTNSLFEPLIEINGERNSKFGMWNKVICRDLKCKYKTNVITA